MSSCVASCRVCCRKVSSASAPRFPRPPPQSSTSAAVDCRNWTLRRTVPEAGEKLLPPIDALYGIEEPICGRHADERPRLPLGKGHAAARFAPTMAGDHLPSRKLASVIALCYALSSWDSHALYGSIEDGHIEIHKNGADLPLAGVALGRKNYLFLPDRKRVGMQHRSTDRPRQTAAQSRQRTVTCPLVLCGDLHTSIRL